MVEVEEYGQEGDGVAHVDGFAIFVEGSVQPGDEVLALIRWVGDRYAFAEARQ